MINSSQTQKLAHQYKLDLLILFGSQTTSQKNHLSDLDLAFYRHKYMPPKEENQLLEDLMAIFKRDDIDLINIKTHPHALLRYQIFMTGQPLYEKKKTLFNHMRWQAYIDYEDFKRFYQQKNELIDKNLRELTS